MGAFLKKLLQNLTPKQVKKNATSGIFAPFAKRKGGKWETHFKRKFKEVNRKCEKGEI